MLVITINGYTFRGANFAIFSSPGRSPGRAIVLPPASALVLAAAASALAKNLTLKVFYVMGKALSRELSCPCDRSCCFCLPFNMGVNCSMKECPSGSNVFL